MLAWTTRRLIIAEEQLGENYSSQEFFKVVCHTFNVTNKKYFHQLAETLEDDEIRGDDSDVSDSDDEQDEQDDDVAPEAVFHQDEYDIEVTLTCPQVQPRCTICFGDQLNAVFAFYIPLQISA